MEIQSQFPASDEEKISIVLTLSSSFPLSYISVRLVTHKKGRLPLNSIWLPRHWKQERHSKYEQLLRHLPFLDLTDWMKKIMKIQLALTDHIEIDWKNSKYWSSIQTKYMTHFENIDRNYEMHPSSDQCCLTSLNIWEN